MFTIGVLLMGWKPEISNKTLYFSRATWSLSLIISLDLVHFYFFLLHPLVGSVFLHGHTVALLLKFQLPTKMKNSQSQFQCLEENMSFWLGPALSCQIPFMVSRPVMFVFVTYVQCQVLKTAQVPGVILKLSNPKQKNLNADKLIEIPFKQGLER